MKNKIIKTLLLLLALTLSLNISGISFADSITQEVYLGGMPIGINMGLDGLVITGKTEVITEKGAVIPLEGMDIYPGDKIIAIDGNEVKNINDVSKLLKCAKENIILTICRKGEYINIGVKPAIDVLTKTKKIGLSIRENICGIGTVTYIRSDGRYGALGHSICDDGSLVNDIQSGTIHKCSILSVVKGKRNQPGELRGVFLPNENVIGTIEKNNYLGIYGDVVKDTNFAKTMIKVGNKKDVKLGEAYIYTTIFGDAPDKYDIEIIKLNSQDTPAEKSMVIKITDKRLLDATSGILQGMSGSPIVQNGSLIGAVTHVMLKDLTKGYGVYIDWMINN